MKYFYHVPSELIDITIDDKLFLYNLLNEYVEKSSYLQGSSFYERYHICESDKDYSEHQLFKKIAKLFQNTEKHHDYKHVYKNSQIAKVDGPIKPHYDYRSCVLAIPLMNVDDPCHFYDDSDNEIASYEYSDVCILNGWAKHGVPENKHRRCFFHVGGFGKTEQLDVLIKKINDIP